MRKAKMSRKAKANTYKKRRRIKEIMRKINNREEKGKA